MLRKIRIPSIENRKDGQCSFHSFSFVADEGTLCNNPVHRTKRNTTLLNWTHLQHPIQHLDVLFAPFEKNLFVLLAAIFLVVLLLIPQIFKMAIMKRAPL